MPDIIADNSTVNLADVAATICAELRSETKSGAAVLHHAMNAGDALNLAKANQHKTNLTWKQWPPSELLYQRAHRVCPPTAGAPS